MKQISLQKILVLFVVLLGINKNAQAQDVKHDVLLQGFYWDSYKNTKVTAEGGTYGYLKKMLPELAASQFDLIWLPPPSDGFDNGYLPKQLFLFDSNHGTTAQLTSLITDMKSRNMHALADIIANHRNGTFSTKGFTNPTWGCDAIVSNDDWSTGGCGGLDEGEGFNGVQDIDHRPLAVQNGYKEYLNRLMDVGFDSWRFDFSKGYPAKYMSEYKASTQKNGILIKPYISIAEYWDGNVTSLKNWINSTTQTLSGTTDKSSAFDFPLFYILERSIRNNNFFELNNAGHMPGLAGENGYADKAVTFLENHDTARHNNGAGEFQTSEKQMKGYAYILTHAGIPMVFLPHYEANKVKITELIAIRKNNGINAWSNVVVSNSGSFYSAIIDGKVAVKIGGGTWSPSGTGWSLKTSGVDYAVWDKDVAPIAPEVTISPAGGNFVTGTTVNVTLSANVNTSTIFYTLDGSTPTINSLSAIGTKVLPITTNTTVKAFVRNVAGVSSAVKTETYTFSTPTEFTVFFKKPSTWNAAVKIYYWNPTGTAPAVSWPGVAMTKDCGDWYKFTFPNTVSASNLLFNDGTLKTVDLTRNAGISYHDNTWLASEPVNRCPVTLPDVTISPVGGNFVTGTTVNVTLSANVNTSTIFYTLDGSTPTITSLSAVGTKVLPITTNTTVKAFVRNVAGISSAIKTETYTFSTPTEFTVYFKKPSNWNTNVRIYYWNPTGTAPAVTWPGVAMTKDCGDWYTFTFPNTVSATNLIFNDGTLKTVDLITAAGIRFYDNAWLNSEPVNRCPVTLPEVSISPAGGNFATGTTVNVTLSANVNTSTIFYTLDGSTPTINSLSAIGTKVLPITTNTTVKAFVRNVAGVSSAVKTETYTFSTPTEFTVYFKKPSTWNSNVRIYYWNPTGTAPAVTWPGVAMTKDCGDWYKFTFPNTVSATNLIFNDGTLKTVDLIAAAGIRFYDGAWLNSEPTNRCPVVQEMTVYFKPPSSWTTTPKVYYWSPVPVGSATTTWPGNTMVVAENGFYKYTIVGPSSANIIFNNGTSGQGNQTQNLLNKTNGFSYTWADALARIDTSHATENTLGTATISTENGVSIYPNPVTDILYVNATVKPVSFSIVTLQGILIKTGTINGVIIDFSDIAKGIYITSIEFENGEVIVQKIMKN